MTIGILKEPTGENRVSLLPEQASALAKNKVSILLETGAGVNAFANDNDYAAIGVTISSRAEVLMKSDIILSIQLPEDNDVIQLKPGVVILGIYQPLYNSAAIHSYATKGIITF